MFLADNTNFPMVQSISIVAVNTFHHDEADEWKDFLVVNKWQNNKLAKLSSQCVLYLW